MTKLEDYTAKAAESLAAAEASTTDRDRIFHHRAHSVWRRLIAGIGEAEARAAMKPERKPSPLKAPPPKATWQ